MYYTRTIICDACGKDIKGYDYVDIGGTIHTSIVDICSECFDDLTLLVWRWKKFYREKGKNWDMKELGK